MRKLLSVLFVSVLLLALVVPTVLAEPKPTNIPHEVAPTDAEFAATFGSASFDDLWVELYGDWGAMELPQGLTPKGEDTFRGPVPIGFNFKFMDGPVDWYRTCYPYFDENHKQWLFNCVPDGAYLTNAGYDELFVAINGLVLFKDQLNWDYAAAGGKGQPRGSWNWYPKGFDPTPPNNYIAPFYNDLRIGDNGLFRPRGRLLYKTVGDAPNRRFVVEWANARNFWTGNRITFELQLFEGSNAILFLYGPQAFRGRGVSDWLVLPSLIIGMEDIFGKTYVGQLYLPWGLPAGGILNDNFFLGNWIWSPVHNGDMIGFVY